MKHPIQVVLLLGFLLSTCIELQSLAATTAGSLTFFVATNGNDKWSGLLADPNARKNDGPFATLPRALQAMRDSSHLAKSNRLRSTIYVRAGLHLLTDPLVLTSEDSGIQIAAFRSEQPILSGGARIS